MTKQDIRNSIRNITGHKSQFDLSDAVLDDRIDRFYLYDLPERLKTLELEGWLRFNLQPNVSRYALAGAYSSGRPNPDIGTVAANAIQQDTILVDDIYKVEMPAYVDGYEIGYYQDPTPFYRTWPDQKVAETLLNGDGTAGAYAFTMTNVPVEIGSVVVTAGDQSSRDNGAGGWYEANYAGTINYDTGAVTVTFPNAVPTGTAIYIHYYPFVPSRPTSVLFFEQFFVFRPIPNIGYEFRVKVQRRPTSMPSADSSPEFAEWGDMIAYGTALKIFIEDGDWDEYNKFYPIFQEQKNLAQRRALKELKNQQVATPYNANMGQPNLPWPYYQIT